tara:strand:+ start:2603 stop:2869 length:267 start_codon:yes stop_codon:yes gene_type:complete
MNKDNSGALFKVEDKKSDKHPDYTGNCIVGGKKMYIASWINTTEKGMKYMSLSFTEPSESAKYSKETSSASSKPAFAKPDTTKNDLPF